MTVEQDALDGYWQVLDASGHIVRYPFACEQDAYDWIEAFGDGG